VARSIRVLAVAVLTIVLVLCVAKNVSGWEQCVSNRCWLGYDNGVPYTGGGPVPPGQTAIKFSLPVGWASASLLNARFYAYEMFTLHVYAADGMTELTAPGITVSMSGPWSTISLSGKGIDGGNIIVTDDFYVSLEFGPGSWEIAADEGPDQGHGYRSPTTPPAFAPSGENYLIRAEVEQYMPPSSAPVGGFIESVNKLAVFAPYLALFGIVATVAVVIVKPWKKPEN